MDPFGKSFEYSLHHGYKPPKDHPTTQFKEAEHLVQSKRYGEAYEILDQLDNKQDDTQAQNLLGDMHLCGMWFKQNAYVAEKYYLKAAAAEGGDPIACINLGYSYLLEGKDEEAMAYFANALSLQGFDYRLDINSSADCKEIAANYRVHKNFIAAFAWQKRAEELTANLDGLHPPVKPAESLHQTILESALSNIEQRDYLTAFKELILLAKYGNSDAELYLGAMYYFGLGVGPSYQIPMLYYKASAEKGNARACNAVGLLHQSGEGVPRNDQTAQEWFAKAKAIEAKENEKNPNNRITQSWTATAQATAIKESENNPNNKIRHQNEVSESAKPSSTTTTTSTSTSNTPPESTSAKTAPLRKKDIRQMTPLERGQVFLLDQNGVKKDLDRAIENLKVAYKQNSREAGMILGQARYERYTDSIFDTDGDRDAALALFKEASEYSGEACHMVVKLLMDSILKDWDQIVEYTIKAYAKNYKDELLKDKILINALVSLSDQYLSQYKQNFLLTYKIEKTIQLLNIAVEAKHPKAQAKLQIATQTQKELK